MTTLDTYSNMVLMSTDVTIRRLGWRLSGEQLNPLGYKCRTELNLKTWGMQNLRNTRIRQHNSKLGSTIRNQTDYDRNLNFMLDCLEFYESETPVGTTAHPFDELVPTLMNNDFQLCFSQGTDQEYADLAMADDEVAHEYRIVPKFLACQNCDAGMNLRSAGFTPSLELLQTPRYLTGVGSWQ